MLPHKCVESVFARIILIQIIYTMGNKVARLGNFIT